MRIIDRRYSLFALSLIINFLFLLPAIRLLSVEGRDFQQDYLGAKRLLHQANVYEPFTTAEIAGIGTNPGTGIGANFHPATTLLFVLPLTGVSFSTAVYIWSFFSIVCFLAGIFILTNELNHPRWFLLSFLSFAYFPFWLHIRFGQFSTLIFLLITLSWKYARHSRWEKSAGALSIAALAKIFPAFLILVFLWHKKWKAILTAVITVTIPIIALFLWAPNSILSYIDVARDNQLLFRAYYGNFGINGLVGRLLIGSADFQPLRHSERWYTIISYLLAALAILAVLWYFARVNDLDRQYAFAVTAMLLVSPTTWAHNWTILLLPIAILYASTNEAEYRIYRIGLLVALLLSGFPHWQFLDWLKTLVLPPMPVWLSMTPGGLYVLPLVMLLFIAEASQRYGFLPNQQSH